MSFAPPGTDAPVIDDVVVERLCLLRDRVARPGEDVLGELLSLFERDAHVRLDDLARARSREEQRLSAHALKGAAANVGAARVAAWAAHIEKNECCAEALAQLAREITAAVAALRVRLA